MAYQESDFQTAFGSWITEPQHVALFGTSNFELKVCKGKSINPVNDFQPQQLPELWNSKNNFVYHKISDQSLDRKPWDCSLWVGTPAYVVIMFYVPRKPKRFTIIDIDVFLEAVERSEKPYLKQSVIETLGITYAL